MTSDISSGTMPKKNKSIPSAEETFLDSTETALTRRLLNAYKQMLVALFVATLVVIAALMIVLLPYTFLFNTTNKNPPLIFVIIGAGSLGAFFSSLIRLYNFEELPKAVVTRELQELPKWHLLIYSLVPALVGAIAATVLYLIFAAELMQGDLFPKFRCDLENGACDLFRTLLDNWHPDRARDYAKALVWAFIAGFAERLVPTTLQNLSKTGQSLENQAERRAQNSSADQATSRSETK